MRSAVRAAGGLLWRERDGVLEVALVHRPKHQDWSLPKGKLATGEHPLAAAYREVAEETGVRPVVGVRLPSTSYPVLAADGAADKTVDYWAMRAGTAGTFTPSREVDELRWMPLDEVDATLTYRRDGDVVHAFTALPRPLCTVVLLHHAAQASREWDGPDVTRPLDGTGTTTAERLAGLLALFAPVRLVSATPRRCVQTLEPLAAERNLEIESDSVFDTEAHARAPEVTADRLVEFATYGETVVVCSQPGVIPDTVALLADSDGLDLPTVRTPAGSGWVLSFADRKLVAADFLSADE